MADGDVPPVVLPRPLGHSTFVETGVESETWGSPLRSLCASVVMTVFLREALVKALSETGTPVSTTIHSLLPDKGADSPLSRRGP